MDELENCPFCGKQHKLEPSKDFHWGENLSIICDRKALLSAYSPGDRKQLIAYWNHRPIEDALRAELAQARERIAELELRLDIGGNLDQIEPPAFVDRWIPVGESLPEDHVPVWAYGGTYVFEGYYSAETETWYHNEKYYSRRIGITHWMPLSVPPPPE